MTYTVNSWAIFEAVKFYESRGYKLIPVPMIVEEAAISCTTASEPHKHLDGYYVGSAEQSFVQMALNGKLKGRGKYMAITPCVRADTPDETHLTVFLKLELIKYGSSNYLEILSDADDFFTDMLRTTRVIKTTEGSDIFYGDLELGSYGYRNVNGVNYSYGTGIAEPRFSMAEKLRDEQCDKFKKMIKDL